MESGDPLDRQDAKRVRLESLQISDGQKFDQPHSAPRTPYTHYHQDAHQQQPPYPPHIRPQSQPPPPLPQPPQALPPSRSVTHHPNPSYPDTRAPPPQSDSRILPPPDSVARVADPGHHAFQRQPSFSSPMTTRPWGHDGAYSRPPSNSLAPSPSAEQPPRPLTVNTSASHDPNRPMDHSAGLYHEHPQSNGLPNGYSSNPHQDPYGPPPVNQGHYVSAPVTPGYAPYGPSTGPQTFPVPPRKKQVRAVQACNTCRSRKQKCNEARPCDFCKENGLECEYKDVPPPKQDRTMKIMMDKLDEVVDVLGQIHRRVVNLEGGHKLGNETAPHISSASVEAASETSPTIDDESDEMSVERQLGHHMDSQKSTTTLKADQARGSVHTSLDEPLLIRFPDHHTTAAHQLMITWKHIRVYFNEAGIPDDSYVMDLEQSRGLLRLWGRGEGDDRHDGGHVSTNSPPMSDDGSVASSPQSDGLWGHTQGSPGLSQPIRRFQHDADDLDTEGFLRIDDKTVYNLTRLYRQNMHVLHPFLDAKILDRMMNKFVGKHTSNPRSPAAPSFAIPTTHGMKRKRSDEPSLIFRNDCGSSPAGSQRKQPERSISTAICLLVCAIGRICKHKRPVPGPTPSTLGTYDDMESSPHPMYADSPPGMTKPSPATSHSTIASITSPMQESGRNIPRSRRASVDANNCSDQASPGQRNIDVIPGLVYYAHAASILGDLQGGNDLSHAHAFLLAALYMGQLGRVMESWSWINAACRVCNILVEKEKSNLNQITNPELNEHERRRNLIKFAFWTALQLESDIRAELSALPRSGIHDHEHRVAYPAQIQDEDAAYPSEHSKDEASALMMYHYSTQIHLRKVINNVHTELYGPGQNGKRGDYNPQQVDEAAAFSDQLDTWRRLLPQPLRWDDDDAPPQDIYNARLRAKYYGGKYVALRMILRHAIYNMDPQHDLLDQYLMDRSISEIERRQRDGLPLSKDESTLLLIKKCDECVKCAQHSTEAFDGCPMRLIVTNIFGTAHAQFGNMLVLTATWQSWLRRLVDQSNLQRLNRRTINFLKDIAPISPTAKKNITVLQVLDKYLADERIPPIFPKDGEVSVHSSFSALN